MIDMTQAANLTIKDVAKYFNVSASTINRWRWKYGLPSYLFGSNRRFSMAKILEWQEKHQEVIENEKPMRSKKESLKLYEGVR